MSSPATYTYRTKLLSLIATGPTPSRSEWQDSILTYITQNCSVSNSFLTKAEPTYFPSPLPVNIVPKSNLLKQLKTVENGDSALNLAIKVQCPCDVIAALCHLHPKAATIADSTDSLPLHHAAKRPTSELSGNRDKKIGTETLKIIEILIQVNQDALITSNGEGKTPLHCLLEHHAENRTVAVVEMFSRTADEKAWQANVDMKSTRVSDHGRELPPIPVPSMIKRKNPNKYQDGTNVFTPASALILPDQVHGCIPLHYAVMNGAVKDVVKYLVKSYPASVSRGDNFRRTPLHWTLGAAGNVSVCGDPNYNRPPMHQTYRSSGVIAILLHKDPAFPFEAAKVKDDNILGQAHRTPLHYAVSLIAKNLADPPSLTIDGQTPTPCLSLKALKFLIDCNRSALTEKDSRGQTPLHVLFRTIHEWNDCQYQKALNIAHGGPEGPGLSPADIKVFSPPMDLVKLLIQKSILTDNSKAKKVNAPPNPLLSSSTEAGAEGRQDENSVTSDGDHNTDAENTAVEIQDSRGLLPLHCAVLCVAEPKVLSALLKLYPTSLVQATHLFPQNERDANAISKVYDIVPNNVESYVSSFGAGRSALHMAFANPHIARWHSEVTLAPLLFFNLNSDSTRNVGDPAKPEMMVDGTIVLKKTDAMGETPLHLAARNNASLPLLRVLLKCHPDGAFTKSKEGNLPLHLLLDKENFFNSVDLAEAGTKTEKKKEDNSASNPFEVNQDADFREKIKRIAKKQILALKMEEFKLGGAIFAPSSGWTSDEDAAERSKDRNDFMHRVYLLSKPLIHDQPSLTSACSTHGLLPLHIAIAFHALPYQDLRTMLVTAPEIINHRSAKNNFTALDMHSFRSTVPREINSSESESWRAIRQLLFAFEAVPLDKDPSTQSDAFALCRKEKDFLASCAAQVAREKNKVNGMRSYHEDGKHPIDPEHVRLGISTESVTQKNDNGLSPVCERLWIFFSLYRNMISSDNYSLYIEAILAKIPFKEVKALLKMQVPEYTKEPVPKDEDNSDDDDEPPIETINDVAHPHCKKVMHSYYYFIGRFDFPLTVGSSILLHRGANDESIVVRAASHTFDIQETKSSSEGKEDGAVTKHTVKYKTVHENVCLKLMKNKTKYENEIQARSKLGVGKDSKVKKQIVPLIAHYDATVDKKFARDKVDVRFRKLPVGTHVSESEKNRNKDDFLDISSYDYAIVLPLSAGWNLCDSITHGTVDLSTTKDICKDMGEVLQYLHSKNFVHGSFSISNIMAFPSKSGGAKQWKLTKLNTAQEKNPLGMIKPNGCCMFESNILPPEMFLKLTPPELALYEQYWGAVLQLEETNISPDLIKPRIDPLTADAYVMRCYCDLPKEIQEQLPTLPYNLLNPSEATDVWSFGVFLFTLVTGGDTLVQANMRTGNITCMEVIANWDADIAGRIISQYVYEVTALDLLVHILVRSEEERAAMDMETILSHPFFMEASEITEDMTEFLTAARDEREAETFFRQKKINDEKQGQQLMSRAATLPRLTLETQLKIVTAPSELLKAAFDPENSLPQVVPYAYVILPYQLGKDGNGKLTPIQAEDIEVAESLGERLIALKKACYFVSSFKRALENADDRDGLLQSWFQGAQQADNTAAIVNMLDTLDLHSGFSQFGSYFFSLAMAQSDTYFSNPVQVASVVLDEAVKSIVATFAVTNTAYLYLLDESSGVPVAQSGNEGTYPHVFTENIPDIVCKSLPFLYACISHMMGIEEGVKGLVKVVVEGAYPLVPPQWEGCAQGLTHSLNKGKIVSELNTLYDTTQSLIQNQGSISEERVDELQFLRDFLQHIDDEQTYCGLKPVTDGKFMMWTSEETVRSIEDESAKEVDPLHLEKSIREMHL